MRTRRKQGTYSKMAFRRDEETRQAPRRTDITLGKGTHAAGTLSGSSCRCTTSCRKRSSGDLPADYDFDVKPDWGIPQAFDRHPDYDPSWLRYDEVDIYGEPLD